MFLKIKANIVLHPVVISATILRNITKDSGDLYKNRCKNAAEG